MRKVLRSDKNRFKVNIDNTQSAIVIALPSMNKFTLFKFNNLINKCKIKSRMTLKRLFHKMFFGERSINEKLSYSGNLHLFIPTNETNYGVFNRIRSYNSKFIGSICNGKFTKNYGLAIKSQFNNNKAAIILLAKLLSLVAVVIKNSKILNKDN